MRYDHDWSISDDTIYHKLVSRSDTITYVSTGLSRWSPRWGVNLTWSSQYGFPIWDDVAHTYRFWCVHLELTHSVVTGYDCGQDVFHNHNQGYHDLSKGYNIYCTIDYWLHCFLIFYRVNMQIHQTSCSLTSYKLSAVVGNIIEPCKVFTVLISHSIIAQFLYFNNSRI